MLSMSNSEFPEGHRLSHIERLVDVIDQRLRVLDGLAPLSVVNGVNAKAKAGG